MRINNTKIVHCAVAKVRRNLKFEENESVGKILVQLAVAIDFEEVEGAYWFGPEVCGWACPLCLES